MIESEPGVGEAAKQPADGGGMGPGGMAVQQGDGPGGQGDQRWDETFQGGSSVRAEKERVRVTESVLTQG
jgi:hypothetical protein